MVKEMDVVTLNCPLHPETEYMVNADTVKLFKRYYPSVLISSCSIHMLPVVRIKGPRDDRLSAVGEYVLGGVECGIVSTN